MVNGCTNPLAHNFDPNADLDDGSCIGPALTYSNGEFVGTIVVTGNGNICTSCDGTYCTSSNAYNQQYGPGEGGNVYGNWPTIYGNSWILTPTNCCSCHFGGDASQWSVEFTDACGVGTQTGYAGYNCYWNG